jgi:hypothetical protein
MPSNAANTQREKKHIMKITKLVTITTAFLLTAGAVLAQETQTTTTTTVEEVHVWHNPSVWWNNHFVYTTTSLYTPNELSVDMFGSYIAPQRGLEHLFDTSIRGHRGVWGGGVGFNYFFTRQLGVGADINIPANGHNFIDSGSGNLILRIPIDPTGLAPYIFGGGGRQSDPRWAWFGQAGVGLEYRFNPVTGIFIDGRYVWAQQPTPESLMLRSGVRFVF